MQKYIWTSNERMKHFQRSKFSNLFISPLTLVDLVEPLQTYFWHPSREVCLKWKYTILLLKYIYFLICPFADMSVINLLFCVLATVTSERTTTGHLSGIRTLHIIRLFWFQPPPWGSLISGKGETVELAFEMYSLNIIVQIAKYICANC